MAKSNGPRTVLDIFEKIQNVGNDLASGRMIDRRRKPEPASALEDLHVGAGPRLGNKERGHGNGPEVIAGGSGGLGWDGRNFLPRTFRARAGTGAFIVMLVLAGRWLVIGWR